MKAWLQDFPGTNAGHVVTSILILLTGLVVCVKLALGHMFPAGYDTWLWVLAAMAGVNVAGMGVKRATDVEYKKAGTSPVTVEAPSTVSVTTAPVTKSDDTHSAAFPAPSPTGGFTSRVALPQSEPSDTVTSPDLDKQ